MNGILFICASSGTDASLADNLRSGVVVALMGILIVFLILCILWGVLELMKLFFYTIPQNRKNRMLQSSQEPEAAVIPEPTVIPEVVPSDEAADVEDEYETVAVITAALSEYLGRSSSGFRIVSFRRAGSKNR